MPRKVPADDPTRLYESDLIERLTRAHPAEPFVIFTPIVVGLMVYGLMSGPHTPPVLFGLFGGGVLLWTLCEYFLHRYLFHYEARSEFGKRQMKLIHGIHHQFPNDTDRLVIPPAVGGVVAIGFFGLYTLTLGLFTGLPVFAGFITGYMAYDWVHYSTHHRKPLTFIGRAQRRRHLLHHYKYPDACYGVSTGLWDVVFGTTVARAVSRGRVKGHPDGVWRVVDNKIK